MCLASTSETSRPTAWPAFWERLGRPQGLLVLAPHPDDETLGCGGLIAAAAAAGVRLDVVFLTSGEASHPASRAYPKERLAALREDEARSALRVLGWAGEPAFLRLPDAATLNLTAEDRAEAEATILGRARRLGADIVFTPKKDDPHCDHLFAHRLGRDVAGRIGATHLCYRVWQPANAGVPGGRSAALALGELRGVKAAALRCHRSQLGEVIVDDPGGFTLTEAELRPMMGPCEVYTYG